MNGDCQLKKYKKRTKNIENCNTSNSTTMVVQAQQSLTLDPKTWQCWAHARSGKRCKTLVQRSCDGEPIPIPYCTKHIKSGDFALKVVQHPFAGKCLVARWPLPSKYRIAFHGIRGKCRSCDVEDRAISFFPPNPRTGLNLNPADGTTVTSNYNGVLNPGDTGDLIQYAACPGPNERQNMRSTFRYWGKRNGTYGGLEFVTLEPIKENQQLCHWYGPGWWSARGIKRKDVGTTKYPAPQRRQKCNTNSSGAKDVVTAKTKKKATTTDTTTYTESDKENLSKAKIKDKCLVGSKEKKRRRTALTVQY